MDRKSKSHHHRAIAAFLIAVAMVAVSCSADVERDGSDPHHRTEAQLIAEIKAAQAEATACRKVIDKPLRCLP